MGGAFSGSGNQVAGTGQSVGELKNAGWSASDIAGIDKAGGGDLKQGLFGLQTPEQKQRAAAAGGQVAKGVASLDQRPQGGQPVQFNVQQPQVDPSLATPDSGYLSSAQDRLGKLYYPSNMLANLFGTRQ